MKTMSKSAKKFFAAAVCMSMLLTVFVGCNQLNGGNPSNPQKSSEKKLIEFMFAEAKVDGLHGDIYGKIDEKNKTVLIEVPAKVPTGGIDITKLNASFKISDKAQLLVGEAVQESGKTKNDFTTGVTYTVKAEDGSVQDYTVTVKEAEEKEFSALPADQQTEIQSLYGYYWADDGNKNECPAIDAERLAVYTSNEFMSMGFTNLRWSRVSSSMWVCYSYAEEDTDYEEKRIIFTFVKDNNGTLKDFDTIVRMNGTYGPYVKGKAPDKFEESGKTYYTYDKATYDKEPKKSPKMFEPALK